MARHRRLLATGIRRAFTRLAQQAPLVVVLGRHAVGRRAEPRARQSSLMRRVDALPILTCWSRGPTSTWRRSSRASCTIELGGLEPRQPAAPRAGAPGRDATASPRCARISCRARPAIPFFLLEMVDALLERGSSSSREGPDGQEGLRRVEGGRATRAVAALDARAADRRSSERAAARRAPHHRLARGRRRSARRLRAGRAGGARGGGGRGAALRARPVRRARRRRRPAPPAHARRRLPRARRQRARSNAPLARRAPRGDPARERARRRDRRAPFRARRRPREGGQASTSRRPTPRWASYQMPLATRYFNRALTVLPESNIGAARARAGARGHLPHPGPLERAARPPDRAAALRAPQAGTRVWGATALLRTARFDLDTGQLAHGLTLAQKGELAARQRRFGRARRSRRKR